MSPASIEQKIKQYRLEPKLKELAKKDREHRSFKNLPKQFSKGILVGNIAVVPRQISPSRFVYLVADMTRAEIVYDHIYLKHTAILVAHYLADEKEVPKYIVDLDQRFASKLFEIQNCKRICKSAKPNSEQEFIYENKLAETHISANRIKKLIEHEYNVIFKNNIRDTL